MVEKFTKALKNRSNEYISTNRSQDHYLNSYILFLVGLLPTSLILAIVIYFKREVLALDKTNAIFASVGIVLCMLFTTLSLKCHVIKAPSKFKKKEKQQFLYEMGKTKIILDLLSTISIYVFFISFSFFDISLKLATIVFGCYLIYYLTYLVVVIKPSRILSNNLTTFGSSFLFVAYLTFPFLFLVRENPNYLIFIILMILAVRYCTTVINQIIKPNKLNPVQYNSIQTVLSKEFKKTLELLKVKLKAKEKRDKKIDKFLIRIEKDLDAIDKKQLFEKLLIEQNTLKIKFLILIPSLLAIVLFILSSISEGLIQDLFNENIKHLFKQILRIE